MGSWVAGEARPGKDANVAVPGTFDPLWGHRTGGHVPAAPPHTPNLKATTEPATETQRLVRRPRELLSMKDRPAVEALPAPGRPPRASSLTAEGTATGSPSEARFTLCEPRPHNVGPRPHVRTRVPLARAGQTWRGRPPGPALLVTVTLPSASPRAAGLADTQLLRRVCSKPG